MALYPCALLPNIDQQFCDADGAPLVGGTLTFYIAGTDTLAAVFSDADGDVPMTNPVELESDGRPASAIYVAADGYKAVLKNSGGATVYTRDMWEDVGQVFANQFGYLSTVGGKNVTSGYQCLDTDRLVTVDSAGGPDPCVITLLPASDALQPITIKNFGNVALSVVGDGSDTIDGELGAYTVPVAVNPICPTITLISDTVSSWYVQSSHGF